MWDVAFDVLENGDIKIGRVGFDSSGVDPREFREADGAWKSLITTYKGVAFNIMKREESPSEGWRQLTAYYQVEGVREQRCLQKEFGFLKMEPGDYPNKFTLKADRTVAEIQREGLDLKEDQINVAIISGVSHKYEMERRISDCEANLTRQKIELIIR